MRRHSANAVLFLCALCAAAVAGDSPSVAEVAAPRPATWEEVSSDLFQPFWTLPEQRVDGSLPLARRPPDLVADMLRFASLEFPCDDGEEAELHTLSVGNLMAALGRNRTDPQRRSLLERLRRMRPAVHRRVKAVLPQLVLQDRLHGKDWDPDEDHPNDGLLQAPPVRRDVGRSRHFSALPGDEMIHQAAVFVLADTSTIKEVENDYAAYMDHVGANYEMIHAVRDSYVSGKDPHGRPFSALSIAFRSDLPFPYGTFSCDLRILNRVGSDGLLRTHIYSPSEDFHWLAGQDVYIPVKTTEGGWVGTLLVRLYGFDIDDVPDGEGARRAALRRSLGNLKRLAEKLFAQRGAKGPVSTAVLPSFRVRGFAPREHRDR